MRLKAVHDRRLAALDDFIGAYEAEFGEITEQDMAEAARRASANAVVIRGTANRSRGQGAA